ncbi:universal stress protein [Actinospica robiniae]|uniref:universal stress protein n=1 Tax=Actinospica robiniae TaxID=304901 RepID=UPI0004258D0B|nr:universal stress protein [Actinospica robiniae]
MRTSDGLADERFPGPVVAGVDASENSAGAAAWAALAAMSRGVPLMLVHALELPSALPLAPPGYAEHRRAEGQRLLEAAAARVQEHFIGVDIEMELSDLSAARTLSALSTEAALLVTGTRGRGGFAGMLLGSVSRSLAAHAHCPLVVVRGEVPEPVFDGVVLGIGPDRSDQPFRFAFAAASRYRATLHAVRAWSPTAMFSGPTGGYYEEACTARCS